MSSAPGKVRPSGFWYLLPVLLILAGGVLSIVFIVGGVNAYSDTIEGYARVPVGETKQIQIDGTGGYTVFWEPGVADEDQLDASAPEPPLTMTAPGGQPVTFEDYSGVGTYASSGYVGVAVQTFHVDDPGQYQLAVGGEIPGGVIAVGRSPFDKITGGVVLGLLAGFGGFVLAVVIFIILMISRGRSKRRMRSAAYTGGYGGQPTWTPTPAPAYQQQPQQYPPQQPPPQQYPPQQPPPAQYPPQQPPGGGFGPPPAAPPAQPWAPPPPPGDDSSPGWGQPGR